MAGLTAYLDNSATTRPLDSVISAMAECMRDGFYNPSALYAPALAAEEAVTSCRQAIAKQLKCKASEITFTSGGTESNNLAILGSMEAARGNGRVVCFSLEHPSVLAACEYLSKRGRETVYFGALADGSPDMAALNEALTEDTALVCCMQVNNELGSVADESAISKLVRRKSPGALLFMDGVQGFLRSPFDARLADMYALSSHKLNGPKGVGALYVREGVRLAARQMGGGQENGLRSGTENTPGIAGLNAAVRFFSDCEAIRADLRRKKLLMAEAFASAVPCALVNGPKPSCGAPHILNMSFPGVRGEVMLHALEAAGVYASTGSACSSKKRKVSAVLLKAGISPERAECALRFSLSPVTTDDEILYAAERLGEAYAAFKRYQRR